MRTIVQRIRKGNSQLSFAELLSIKSKLKYMLPTYLRHDECNRLI